MSSIAVGQIFDKVRIKGMVASGDWLVEVEGHELKSEALVSKANIPKKLSFEIGKYLPGKFVVISTDAAIRIGHRDYIKNYVEQIIDYYYLSATQSIGQVKVNLQAWLPWLKRWSKECSVDFADNFKVQSLPNSSDDFQQLIHILDGKGYMLPIFGAKESHILENPVLFFPSLSLSKKGNDFVNDINPYAYKSDGNSDVPIAYSARINASEFSQRSRMDILELPIKIYLHSYTIPFKWHYGVWKHVLGLAPQSNCCSDGVLWSDFIEQTDINNFRSLFSQCRPNKDMSSCASGRCSRQELFKYVHPELKDLSRQYFEKSVICFEKATTSTVYIYSDQTESWAYAELLMDFYNKLYSERLVLRGVSLNWWEDPQPVFHFAPITYFRYGAEKTLTQRTATEVSLFMKGKVTGVSRYERK